jgi:hypothetical protein
LKEFKRIKSNIKLHPEKLILLAGAGQNVGKTTFACQVIQHIKSLHHKVYAIKISPHFHEENPTRTIFVGDQFILSLEDKKESRKDTGRMLKAGADEVFFLQVTDKYLKEAFEYTMSFVPSDALIVIESGALRELINPAIFFFLQNSNSKEIKENAKKLLPLADQIIEFDGSHFSFHPKNIQIINGLVKLID